MMNGTPCAGTSVFRLCTVISFLMGAAFTATAAFEEISIGARYAGMGSASVADRGPESLFYTPAGMGSETSPAICFFSVMPYGIKELAAHSASAVVSTRLGNFGFGVLATGQEVYRETTFALGWSRGIGKRFVTGLAVRMLGLRIRKYGSWSGWALDAGIQTLLGERGSFGFAGTNLNGESVGERNSPLPQTTRIGFRYRLAEGLSASFELDKEVPFPVEFRGGIEYHPTHSLNMRFGFGRNPSNFACGFGVNWRRMTLDYACTVHPVLGPSHMGSITFAFSKQESK
jgi:hypothetical protein